jgi:dihydropteroate synthase
MAIVARPRLEWRLRSRNLRLGERTLVMGILNATPDSFSDGGCYLDHKAALHHALRMLDEGADLIDLGGESTRPNATPVTPAEEQERVLPVLRAIVAARPEAILSIDSYHGETARLAVEAGAEIVNDVSGLLWDEAMGTTCASLGCGTVLMHTRGRPQQWRSLPVLAAGEVTPLVLRELCGRVEDALSAGIERERIVLDPGFGFGKVDEENYQLLAQLETLHRLGFPLLIGLSRKRFLGHALEQSESSPAVDRASAGRMMEDATQAANTAAILAGAHILRVHDVGPTRAAAAIADRILVAASPASCR